MQGVRAAPRPPIHAHIGKECSRDPAGCAPVRHRENGDIEYPIASIEPFYYLCGFPGTGTLSAVLRTGPVPGEYLLFVVSTNYPTRVRWDGARAEPTARSSANGVDDAFPIAEIDEILPGLMEGRAQVLFTPMG